MIIHYCTCTLLRCKRCLKQSYCQRLQLGHDFLRGITVYNKKRRPYSIIVVYNRLFVIEVYSRFTNDLGTLTFRLDTINTNKPTE